MEDCQRAAKTDETKATEDIAKQRELDTYRLKTAQLFSYVLIISLVGIRTLAGLAEPEELKKLDDLHRTMFSFVDIILTGEVIAGGSAAINIIARVISDFLKLKYATDSKISVNTKIFIANLKATYALFLLRIKHVLS